MEALKYSPKLSWGECNWFVGNAKKISINPELIETVSRVCFRDHKLESKQVKSKFLLWERATNEEEEVYSGDILLFLHVMASGQKLYLDKNYMGVNDNE